MMFKTRLYFSELEGGHGQLQASVGEPDQTIAATRSDRFRPTTRQRRGRPGRPLRHTQQHYLGEFPTHFISYNQLTLYIP